MSDSKSDIGGQELGVAADAVLDAEFSQSRNDMYWKVWAPGDGFIRWAGYDDDYWWTKIATDASRFDRAGDVTGHRYRLDPFSGKVTVHSSGSTPQ